MGNHLDWKLSDETVRALGDIDDNRRQVERL
jgi:hypothetical protein